MLAQITHSDSRDAVITLSILQLCPRDTPLDVQDQPLQLSKTFLVLQLSSNKV